MEGHKIGSFHFLVWYHFKSEVHRQLVISSAAARRAIMLCFHHFLFERSGPLLQLLITIICLQPNKMMAVNDPRGHRFLTDIVSTRMEVEF